MRAGLLDRKVTIQAPGGARGAFGEVLAGWTDVGPAWASFRATGGNESDEKGGRISRTRATWKLRHMDGITAGCRLVDEDGQDWRIESVLPGGRREWIELETVLHYD